MEHGRGYGGDLLQARVIHANDKVRGRPNELLVANVHVPFRQRCHDLWNGHVWEPVLNRHGGDEDDERVSRLGRGHMDAFLECLVY